MRGNVKEGVERRRKGGEKKERGRKDLEFSKESLPLKTVEAQNTFIP